MANSQTKRRTTNGPTHQAAKSAAKKRRKIDWTRIFLIIIGLMIVTSMILSMFLR